jgi:transposase
VLAGRDSITSIAKQNGITKSSLQLWVSLYDAYGFMGLMATPNRQYDPSFKLEVLSAISREKLSLEEACVRFRITSSALIIGWRDAYKSEGISGLIPKPKGRPPTMKQPIKRKVKTPKRPLTKEEELLKENEYLKAENELLKKLQALVHNKKKQKP